MRRALVLLLAGCALALAACGDDEENTGASGGGDDDAATTATQPDTTATSKTAECREVKTPKPKKVSKKKAPKLKLDGSKTYTAVMKTSCGTIEIKLAASRAPKTAASFVSLARDGFYDDLTFHRIATGFVIQGGDPEGTGQGGPGYSVTEAPPQDLKYERGVVAMAKTELEEPGTSGSQFFIVTADDAGLPPDYALLGRVEKGDDVVTAISEVPADPSDQTPTQPVVIDDVEIKES
jgi:peptidyl-prolyl cis-trans isomerase B (cyclophilin B)